MFGSHGSNLAARLDQRVDRLAGNDAACGLATGELVRAGIGLQIALEHRHQIRNGRVERSVLHPVPGIALRNLIALDHIVLPVRQRFLVNAGTLADKHPALGTHPCVHVGIGCVPVDIPHHRCKLMHKAFAHKRTLNTVMNINDERIQTVIVHIRLLLQQCVPCGKGHIDGIPPGLRVVLAPPVLDQQRPLLIVLMLDISRVLRHAYVVVIALFAADILAGLRIMRLVPGKRMPAHLHHGAAVLEVVRSRVPQEGLNRPADQRNLALAVVHVIVPGNLRDRRSGNIEVLAPPVVKLLIVVGAVGDEVQDVLQVIGLLLHFRRFRNHLRLRHGKHLIGNHVVDGAFQCLELECPLAVLPHGFRIVLVRVLHVDNLTAFPRRVMIWPVHLLKDVQAFVDQVQKISVFLIELLLVNKDFFLEFLLVLGHNLTSHIKKARQSQ